MINAKTPLQVMEIYNRLPCACITVDVTGKIVNVNDTFLDYTSFDREEIVNVLGIEDFLPPENHNQINHLVDLRHNQTDHSEITYVSLVPKDEKKFSCTISSTVLNTGSAIYYYYSFIDCSRPISSDLAILDEQVQVKVTEQQLVKLTLELQKVSHTITHEIQNPLQNILGLISLLRRNYTDSFNSTGLVFLDHIANSGEKMQHHFNSLLENSTNGNNVFDKKYVNLHELIQDVKLKLNDLIIKHNVIINIPEPLPSLFGISDDLHKLFNNLIKNAIQFQKKNSSPTIKITYVEEEFSFHFTIEDNGIGIDEEYHEKIFEEYFKMNPDGDDCSGRGLPESRKIVENHKGSIGVASSPQKGCTIYFSLEK